MGKRGPRPTPTAVLKLRGSWRGDARPPEVRPAGACPKCPAWLDAEAKRKWRRLAPELHRLGLLTPVDGDAFAAYCQAWAEFRLATETLQREGRCLVGPDLKHRPHPCVAQQRSAWAALKDFGALFGLSPSGRVGLPPAAPEQADELDAFLASRERS